MRVIVAAAAASLDIGLFRCWVALAMTLDGLVYLFSLQQRGARCALSLPLFPAVGGRRLEVRGGGACRAPCAESEVEKRVPDLCRLVAVHRIGGGESRHVSSHRASSEGSQP